MFLEKPYYQILDFPYHAMQRLELIGRVCYKSEDKINSGTADRFLSNIIKKGHESVIEHCYATVKLICDRGVSHELVRHRLASYSQESTRYCNYSGGVTFIIPPWLYIEPGELKDKETIATRYLLKDESVWLLAMLRAEEYYLHFLKHGWSPEKARSVLPNALKTEIVITANLREWRHIFKLRCSKQAHPQMREIMIPLRNQFNLMLPIIFPIEEKRE